MNIGDIFTWQTNENVKAGEEILFIKDNNNNIAKVISITTNPPEALAKYNAKCQVTA